MSWPLPNPEAALPEAITGLLRVGPDSEETDALQALRLANFHDRRNGTSYGTEVLARLLFVRGLALAPETADGPRCEILAETPDEASRHGHIGWAAGDLIGARVRVYECLAGVQHRMFVGPLEYPEPGGSAAPGGYGLSQHIRSKVKCFMASELLHVLDRTAYREGKAAIGRIIVQSLKTDSPYTHIVAREYASTASLQNFRKLQSVVPPDLQAIRDAASLQQR